jgi:hypothetical protein
VARAVNLFPLRQPVDRYGCDRDEAAPGVNRPPNAALVNITALTRLLIDTIDGDRFPFSPRIQAILVKIRPESVHEPLPPLKHYEPPRATTARRRRSGRER